MSDYVHAYTAFSWFENCPAKFKWRWVDGNREIDTPAQAEGRAVHEALAARLNGQPIDLTARVSYSFADRMATSLLERGNVLAEMKLAIDPDFEPTQFFSRTAWLRGVLDVLVGLEDREAQPLRGRVFIGDWKTGKRREDDLQLLIFALLVLENYPDVDTVHAANLWLREGKPGTLMTWRRAELPDMRARVLQHAMPIEQAMRDGVFPKKPGPLCAWCPDTSCEFNRRS